MGERFELGDRFPTWCTVSHIMVMSLRSKWAVGKARGGRISQSIRNRRTTRPPAHFQRNPPGRGRLAVFLRCSLDPYESRYGRFTASPARTALKNSQLTCGDISIICETVHQGTPLCSSIRDFVGELLYLVSLWCHVEFR